MATIREMENRVARAYSDIPTAMQTIARELEEKIIDLIRMQQLFEGKNSKGQIIGVYSKATEKLFGGAAKGKIAGQPYNFEDTGDLFKAFDMDWQDGKISVFSTDSKVPLLKSEYETGDAKLFQFTWEHQMELNYEMFKPELIKFLKRAIIRA